LYSRLLRALEQRGWEPSNRISQLTNKSN
jgi:hypothetical protein